MASRPSGDQRWVVSRRTFLRDSGAIGTAALEDLPLANPVAAQELLGEITVAGSSTVFPITTAMSEEFSRENPNVQISVSSTGTGGGFENFFCQGNTDINNASRPIQESEEQRCSENGVEPVEFQMATDALTVVVNQQADWVDCLTFDQLVRIWGPGAVKRWSQVDSEWPDQPINRFGPTAASGTFDFFTETVIGEVGAHTRDYQGTEQDNTIVQAVQGDQYAIGYFGFAFFRQNQDTIKALAVQAPEEQETGTTGEGTEEGTETRRQNAARGACVEPSLETAKSGAYPLARPLFIYVARESLSRQAVEAFARFSLESASTDLISQVGYVPLADDVAQENLSRLNEIVQD